MFEQLVIASGNAGKLRELGALLAPLNITVRPQSAFTPLEADETACTFVENALLKARHASLHAGLPALADDSGICVAALGGAPGVYSARYAGEPKSDARNNDKLLAALAGQADRRAWYYCVMVLVRSADDPQPIIADAVWPGEVLEAPRGAGGFGYDPLFFLPEQGMTAAELDPAVKNTISHRAVATRKILQQIAGHAAK